MKGQNKRKQLKKAKDGNYYMTESNLKICNRNQQRYETPELNDAFQLQYYGFYNVANLQPYANINTLYLNNNVISKIENLGHLKKLITLNLANNRITKIQNLDELIQLFILDLSGNKIEKAQNLKNQSKLTTLNLSGNLLSQPQSVAELQHNKSLTCLNISNNPIIQDTQLYNHLQKIPLLTLYLKDTIFSRSVPSYRKQTISRLKELTYLDERPVTSDERMMVEAWKKGGLQAEKQARKLIQQSKQEKNRKIYQQMTERSQKIQKLRDQLYEKLVVHQLLQLGQLKCRYQQQKKKEPQSQFEIKLIDKKVQQLLSYLKYFREDVNQMQVGQKPEIPNNLCQKHEPDAIYIYGVTQEQLPKIRQVYYPDDPRPLFAKDFPKKQQLRWIQNYDQILQQVCKQYLNKSEYILPVFNLKVHEFDSQCQRKARRFKQEQIGGKIKKLTKNQAQHKLEEQHQANNQLNVLD